MSENPILSILITSWNTRNLLQEALASIHRHPPSVPFEVIVVDNASTDGSAAMVRQHFPAVRLVMNTRNEGYARGNNQAAAIAGGELLLLLGSDIVVIDDSIQKLFEYLTAHNDVGAVSCRLMNPDGSVQPSCRRFPRLRDAVFTYLSLHGLASEYSIAGFDHERTQEVEQPAATCLMVRKTILRGDRLFDERYTILYNDVDLCRHIRSSGWTIMYIGNATIIHHGSQSTKRATPDVRLEMYRNILVYYFRQYGGIAVIVLLPILGVRLALANRGRNVVGLFSLKYLNR